MQEHKNDLTCAGEHYSSFVVRHTGIARLVSLDTLVSTRSTDSTKSNVSSRVEPSGIWAYVPRRISVITDYWRVSGKVPPFRRWRGIRRRGGAEL